MTKKALVLLREDLRVKDNAALSYATQNHEIVTALYVYNKIEFGDEYNINTRKLNLTVKERHKNGGYSNL